MSEDARLDMARAEVRFTLPEVSAVTVNTDIPFHGKSGVPLSMDLYLPKQVDDSVPPACIIIVTGYPDEGFARVVGCPFKEMGSTRSWARLIAASGMAAVTYTNREPEADLHALVDHLRENAGALRIDTSRLGVWASSGNAPLALALVMQNSPVSLACAALCYPYTLDLDGGAEVARAAAQFKFSNPVAGKTVADLNAEVPIFLARAGQDEMPGLNAALDRFATHALHRNLPITVTNHSSGRHAFDLADDSPATRAAIKLTLEFLKARSEIPGRAV